MLVVVKLATTFGVLASLALMTAAPEQAAPTRLPVLTGCDGSILVRPAALSFCGDGNFYLTAIKWAAWGTSGAVAAAVAHQNDCNPYCAAGHFHVYNAAVWLTRAKKCSDGRIQYTRLSYEFLSRSPPHISLGPHAIRAALGVGPTRCP